VKIFLTGGTGFVGGHVARELRERGAYVRDKRVELLDRAALEEAFEKYDTVVHVAALYSYDADPARIERVNIEGTRNVIEACRKAGVSRLLFTSTAGTCGPVPGRPASEEDEPPPWELAVPYKRSKLAAEKLALEAGAVVVNPTTPVGDGDRRPTPTGRMIRDVATGRIRAYVPTTGLNVVDVRDVARGHALALERGTEGERYLLGGANLSLAELFAAVADAAGRPRPRLKVPYSVAVGAARLGLANRDEVRLARLPMYFSSEKAENALGYRAGPVGPALARAVAEVLDAKGGR
jgi:dihydroflavonol-4-reductase